MTALAEAPALEPQEAPTAPVPPVCGQERPSAFPGKPSGIRCRIDAGHHCAHSDLRKNDWTNRETGARP